MIIGQTLKCLRLILHDLQVKVNGVTWFSVTGKRKKVHVALTFILHVEHFKYNFPVKFHSIWSTFNFPAFFVSMATAVILKIFNTEIYFALQVQPFCKVSFNLKHF